jgi:NAD-dependent DNA ligase
MKERIHSRGISHIVVLLTVTFCLIGLLVAYLTTGMTRDVSEKISRETKFVDELNNKIQDSNWYLLKVSPLIMSIEQNTVVGADKVSKYLEDKSKNYPLSGKDLTIENILYKALDKLFESGYKATRSSYEKNTSAKQETTLKEFQKEITNRKNDDLTELKQYRENIVNKKSSVDDKYRLQKDNLNNQKKALDDQLPVITQKFQKDIVKLENERDALKYSLEELASKETYNRDIIEVYGKIINPDLKNRFAFITLGDKDRLNVGLKFMAYRQQKGYVRQWKGQIEVKRVYDVYALVSITKLEDNDNPITDGDYITNIFYHPQHSRFIVLIGKFPRGPYKYSREEIERRLTNMGTIVEKSISLKTDFALIGDDPEETDLDRKNFEWAKKLNIPRIEGTEAKKNLEYYLGD